MTSPQRRKIWTSLSYTLTLTGVAVIVLSGFSFFLQGTRAAGNPIDAARQEQTTTDRQIDARQRRLRIQPQDRDSYILLGEAYLQKARETGDAAYYARAEDSLLQALVLDPRNTRSMSQLGSLSLARHEFQAASRWAQRSFYAAAYGVLGDAQVERGQYEAGVESFQKPEKFSRGWTTGGGPRNTWNLPWS